MLRTWRFCPCGSAHEALNHRVYRVDQLLDELDVGLCLPDRPTGPDEACRQAGLADRLEDSAALRLAQYPCEGKVCGRSRLRRGSSARTQRISGSHLPSGATRVPAVPGQSGHGVGCPELGSVPGLVG